MAAEADTEVEEVAGERGEEMVEVSSTPTWSLWQGIVVSVEAGRGRDHREEVVKEKDILSPAVAEMEEAIGNTRGMRDRVGKGAATCAETLEMGKAEKDTGIAEVKIGQVEEIEMTREDMTVQGEAEVRTGRVEKDEIIDTLTDQGRMRGALQEVEMATKKPGRVKMEHKGEGNIRLDPLRAATQEHLREVVEVKEVEQGALQAGLHKGNHTRSGRKPTRGSPATNTCQVRMTCFS